MYYQLFRHIAVVVLSLLLFSCSSDSNGSGSIKISDNGFAFEAQNTNEKSNFKSFVFNGSADVITKQALVGGSTTDFNGHITSTPGEVVDVRSNEIPVLPGDRIEIRHTPTHSGEYTLIVTPDGTKFTPTKEKNSFVWTVPSAIDYTKPITGETHYTEDDIEYTSEGKIFVIEDKYRKK